MRMLAKKTYSGTILATLLFAVSACGGSDGAGDTSSNEAPVVSSSPVEGDEAAPGSDGVAVIEAEIVTEADVNAANESGADAVKGRRLFARCMACHTVQEGRNLSGPSLYGIVGRPAGSVEGFRYSDANRDSGVVWTEDALSAFMENPQSFMPGTRMIYPGLPAEQDRNDIIAYLKSVVE